MKVKLLVATHKSYWMPDDPMYLPIHVGKVLAEGSLGYATDDTGNSISAKNKNYCELTAIYWGWKNNLDVDAIGLVHYRRHFTKRGLLGYKLHGKKNSVISLAEMKEMLEKTPIIVPNKRRYYIETNESHYKHAHINEPLDKTIKIIENKHPDYLPSCQKMLRQTSAHMFNMFVMKKEYYDRYCEWMFGILFELEGELDLSYYSVSEARVFGYVSELLLDVWIDKNQVPYTELNAMFMEKQSWGKKIFRFLQNKYKKTQSKTS